MDDKDSAVKLPSPNLPSFVEVICTTSGKKRLFAAGTEASFAVSVINSRLEKGPPARHFEAAKEGEEPITFGPNSVLVEYDKGWRLQTVPGPEVGMAFLGAGLMRKRKPVGESSMVKLQTDLKVPPPMQPTTLELNISFSCIAKILAAFILMFAVGGALTFAFVYAMVKIIMYSLY